jgi:hypothetical protein
MPALFKAIAFEERNNVTRSHLRVVGVDAGDDLQDDHRPSVNADKAKTFLT